MSTSPTQIPIPTPPSPKESKALSPTTLTPQLPTSTLVDGLHSSTVTIPSQPSAPPYVKRQPSRMLHRNFSNFIGLGICLDCNPKAEVDPGDGSRKSRESLPVVVGLREASSATSSPILRGNNVNASLSSSLSSSSPLNQYILFCQTYTTSPNPGILTSLRYDLEYIRPSPPFSDIDMLPLAEVLFIYQNTITMQHVIRLDFESITSTAINKRNQTDEHNGIHSHGAISLANIIANSEYLQEIRLAGNPIGPFGACAIAKAFQCNKSVKRISMRKCYIQEKGVIGFINDVVLSEKHSLMEIDMSLNSIGHIGILQLSESLKVRDALKLHPLVVDIEANMVFQEVMNSLTHGVGIILAIIGTYLMTKKSKHLTTKARLCVNLYSTSLLCLYTASTLYHSFFSLKKVKRVFSVLDHCAIYILIAGSYTPFLGITFPDDKIMSFWLLLFLWICCFIGVYIEAFHSKKSWRKPLSLFLYLSMGWTALVTLPKLSSRFPKEAILLLFAGGLGYTLGVPFFVRNNNLDHSIWHVFVMVGSVFHWWGVYGYILDLDGVDWSLVDLDVGVGGGGGGEF